MKKTNQKNFTYTVVNKFVANKTKTFLLTLGLTLNIAHGMAQQFAFADTKSKVLSLINMANIESNGNAYSGIYKKNPVVLDTATECLDVKGSFDGTVKDFTGIYIARLILENTVVETQILHVKKPLMFTLKKNRMYSIRIEKEGYIPKTISISTKGVELLNDEDMYNFNFETNLLSQELSARFDDDDVDFPVTLVNYNKACDCFENSKEYTASLMKRMVENLFFGM